MNDEHARNRSVILGQGGEIMHEYKPSMILVVKMMMVSDGDN